MSTTTGVQPRTFSWLTDGFRDLLSFQKTPSNDRDKAVSVSDATQPILETGPTAALLRMKEKKDTGAPISQKEWARLAQFVQMGAEFSPNRHISRESVVGILQAFRAAYKLRKPGGDEGKAAYYLNKFNTMGQDEDTIEAAVETHLDHAEWPIGNDARPLVVFPDVARARFPRREERLEILSQLTRELSDKVSLLSESTELPLIK